MHYFSIDHLIVAAFMVITLIIGLRVGRGIKDIREYAIANRMYGLIPLTLTFLATKVGGAGVIGTPGNVFANGIIISVALLGVPITYLIIGIFIAPKIYRFKGAITMGDVMKALYGKHSQVIVGIVGLLYSICIMSIQLLMLGTICEALLGLRASWGIILGGTILTIYSAVGGVKAVTITDVVQFLVILAVIPSVASIALKHAGGLGDVLQKIPSSHFEIWAHKDFSLYFIFFLLWSIFPVAITSQPTFQRLLMARHGRQLRHQYLIASAFEPIFQITVMLIGLVGLALYPNIEAKNVVPQIIKELFPVGFRGIAIAGMLAVVMSTVDSYLNASGLALAHDVIKPICARSRITINELRWAQYGTLLIGAFSIFIVFQFDDIVRLSLGALSFTGPLLTLPLIAGIMGLKTDSLSFWVSLPVTLIAFLSAKFYLPAAQSHLSLPIGITANAFSFLGTHFIKNNGFVLTPGNGEVGLLRTEYKPFLDRFRQYLTSPSNIIRYSQKKVARYGAAYVLFGVFCCISYIFPHFMWIHTTPHIYDLMIVLRFVGTVACGLLIVKDKWPSYLLPYLPTFWHLTLLYCLPFTSTVMFFLTRGSVEWLVNMTMTIMFLVVLVDWMSFITLTVLGVVLGFLFHTLAIGPIHLQWEFSTSYLLMYQGIFATFTGLLFARRKEQKIDKQKQVLINKGEANQTTLLQTAEERFKALKTLQSTGVQNLLQVAKDLQELHLEGKAAEQLHTIEATLIPMAFQLQGIDTRAQDYLRLQVASVSIKQWLTTVQEKLQDKAIDQPIRCKQTTQHKELVCDPEHLTTLLIKSIAALREQAEGHQEDQQPILLGLEDTWLHYPLPDVEKGYIKKVKALRMVVTIEDGLPALAPSYWADLTTSLQQLPPATTQALEQQANERIIKAHYGYAEITPNTLLYVIPIDLCEVRPKDMDKSYMELGVAPVRANDYYKSDQLDAQTQEKEFLAAVAQRSSADIGLVKTALELIKWYHGPVNRHSGEPFYLHPLVVAQLVLDYNTDEATILAALLHDTVEDTSILLKHIEAVFGAETARIVDVVTHLQSIPGSIYKVKLSAAENLRMLERTGNTRGLYVKLADRMHNLRTINGHSSLAKQKQIAQDTLAFFVPLAEKLGLHEAAQELEERSKEVRMKGI